VLAVMASSRYCQLGVVMKICSTWAGGLMLIVAGPVGHPAGEGLV
jgi:hypothetical protein